MVCVGGDLVRNQNSINTDQLLDCHGCIFGFGHCFKESNQLVVSWHGKSFCFHFPQLRKPLIKQFCMPSMVVTVCSQSQLHIELWDRGNPATQSFEELHLNPFVVADSLSRFFNVK